MVSRKNRLKGMSRRLTALVIGVLAVVVVGCNRRPDGVLGKEDMARLMADIQRAEVVVETNTRTYDDSLKRVLRQSIYAKHGVTTEQVDSSLSWYGYNMERYLEVYDRTIEILEKDLELAREKASASNERSTIGISFEGDSVDVWTGERFHRWHLNQPSNLIVFNIMADNNSEKGDAYTLRQKLIGTGAPVELVMVVEYRDGTMDYLSKNFNGDGWHDVRFTLDGNKDARAVFGTLSYRPRPGQSAYVDSLSLVRTRTDGGVSDSGRTGIQHFNSVRRSSQSRL